MSLAGWIQIPRAILDAPWWTEADTLTRALWLHLMLSANFTTTTTRTGLTLKPGQLVTSWAKLADALVCREQGRLVKPHVSKVRRAAALLEKAGEATAIPTGRPTYTGIVVTLERWALYAGDTTQPTDPATDDTTDGLSSARQHRKKDYGSVEGQPRTAHTESNSADAAMRRDVERWTRQAQESAATLAETRARERRETVQ